MTQPAVQADTVGGPRRSLTLTLAALHLAIYGVAFLVVTVAVGNTSAETFTMAA